MIKNIGVDIVKNDRIKLKPSFLSKILCPQEIKLCNSFESEKRKIEFVAGRWAIKEAIIKASEDKIVMNKVNISYNSNGKPIIKNKELEKIHISISHEEKYSIGFAILEI